MHYADQVKSPESCMWPYALHLVSTFVLSCGYFTTRLVIQWLTRSSSTTQSIMTEPDFRHKTLVPVQVPVVSDSLSASFMGQWREEADIRHGQTIWCWHGFYSTTNMKKDAWWLFTMSDLSFTNQQEESGFTMRMKMTMDIAIHLSYGVKRCLMQLAWLLMDDHLYIDAIRAANQPRNHSIDTKQYKAASKFISSIPGSVVRMDVL